MRSKLVLNGILRCECLKAFLHASIVDAQELVLRCGHVDKVRLAFATLFVKELVYRLVCGSFFQIGTDDLKQRFTQMRRAAFSRRCALRLVLAGLVYGWINASETHNGAAAWEAAYISNFSHELGGCCFTNAIHGSYGLILRELSGKPCHLLS